ncbi:GntR family transcriptional regulator [Chromatiales bacterium (ex Bugula neritina AB1)]|nr:GntR family transcriptional regulator [Chromatiales bacterium (ex Bugula neritina AB1)]
MIVAVQVDTLKIETGLKDRVYVALKAAIVQMDVYSGGEAPKLDERQMAEQLGVSRTPVREALTRLEQEGLVRTVPRRGAFVVRKSRLEIIEIIQAWAALEGMAARLATQRATDSEISELHREFVTFDNSDTASANIDEYSEQNICFHQRIVQLGQSTLISKLMDGLFIHMQFIRRRSVRDSDRTKRSVSDHILIIKALETRNADEAQRLVVSHALSLAEHVQHNVDYLD